MTTTKQPLGKIPPEAIHLSDFPRYDSEVIAGFHRLEDLTGTVSDALDELGFETVVPGCTLVPNLQAARIVGPALTLRNVVQRDNSYKGARERVSRMAEIEAHNLAEPGDVLVIQGIVGISNMGGLSASIGHRQGEVGAIVDGSIRDVQQARELKFPVWSRGPSSVTGKWRLETVAVNGTVMIGGVQVRPGDLVVADEGAVCFIPRDAVPAVLRRAHEIAEGEAKRYADIRAGVPVPELAQRTNVYKFQP